jgi:hypothetical protein
MDVDVTPPLEDGERRSLVHALELAELRVGVGDPYRDAWRAAGLREGVDDDEEVRYAFSPRNTRGATRA